MADLLRSTTDVAAPTLSQNQIQPTAGNTSRVLSELAGLTAVGVQLYTKEHEANMTRQANNDIVNNTINPDLVRNESSYAVAITKNQAKESFLNIKEKVLSGEYNDMSPENFQKMLADEHTRVKEGFNDTKYPEAMAQVYDEFWVDKEMTVTAGQAGQYRNKLKQDTASAMISNMANLVKAGPVTSKELLDVVAQPEYELLNEEEISDATLLLGATLAENFPGQALKVLPELNDVLNYEGHPQRSKAYRASMKVAERNLMNNGKAAANIKAQRELQRFQEEIDGGSLTYDRYNEYDTEVISPTTWNAGVAKSIKNKAAAEATSTMKVMFASGQDITSHVTQKEFNNFADIAYSGLLQQYNNDNIKAYEGIGRYLINQTSKKWSMLSDRCSQFGRVELLSGNVANEDAIKRFREIEAFETGLKHHADGEKLFSQYMGNSLAKYLSIKDGFTWTKGPEKETWVQIANSLAERKKTAAKTKIISELSPAAKELGKEIGDRVWDNKDTIIPDFIEKSLVPTTGEDRVAMVAARTYDRVISEGFPEEVAKLTAERKANSQVYRWGGELFDTHGQAPAAIFGTSDPEGAFKTLMEDPEYKQKLENAFGVTLGEMYFGRKYPVTEKGIRKEEARRAGKKKFLSVTEINKEINLENGTLDFKSTKGVGTVFSIPLRDIGALHNAKMQGIENVTRLDRLYNGEFLNTPVGKEWAAKQRQENRMFMSYVLETPASAKHLDLSRQDYANMTDEEQTRVRLTFHNNVYKGIKGRLQQIVDYFGTLITNPPLLDITRQEKPEVTPVNTLEQQILDIIPVTEGTANYKSYGYNSEYDVTLSYGAYDPEGMKRVSDMTLSEAISASESIRKHPDNRNNAGPVGKYQFLGSTIKDLYKIAGLKLTDKMTPTNQEKLAMAGLKRIGIDRVKSGDMTKAEFNKRIKKYWVSLEVHPEAIDELLKD